EASAEPALPPGSAAPEPLPRPAPEFKSESVAPNAPSRTANADVHSVDLVAANFAAAGRSFTAAVRENTSAAQTISYAHATPERAVPQNSPDPVPASSSRLAVAQDPKTDVSAGAVKLANLAARPESSRVGVPEDIARPQAGSVAPESPRPATLARVPAMTGTSDSISDKRGVPDLIDPSKSAGPKQVAGGASRLALKGKTGPSGESGWRFGERKKRVDPQWQQRSRRLNASGGH
ncbi:MAG: hypothetical protein OES09_02450, partial [Gammaproteobacteria bacterium]|nr:hypothetical protein [Gammaproteobacteria bacterium]